MASCVMKESVARLRADAMQALGVATAEEADALRIVVGECDCALAKVRKGWPGYPGGRLDTTDAMKPFAALERLRAKFPDLLPLE